MTRTRALRVLVGLMISLAWGGQAFALAGSVTPVTWTGPITQRAVTFNIYLPQGYATSTTRYAVLYQLHGNGGSPSSDNDSLTSALEHAVAAKIIDPMIIVFPNGYGNSMWADSYDMSKPAETNVIRELIPYVDSHYRTVASHQARVIEGMSMGGFGCLDYAFKFSEQFCCAVSYAAAIDDTWQTADQDHPGIFNGSEAYFNRYSPWVNLQLYADAIRASMPIRMLIGTADMLLPYNQKMRDTLASLNIPVDYVEVPGVMHDFRGLLAQQGDNSFAFIAKHLHLAATPDPPDAGPVTTGRPDAGATGAGGTGAGGANAGGPSGTGVGGSSASAGSSAGGPAGGTAGSSAGPSASGGSAGTSGDSTDLTSQDSSQDTGGCSVSTTRPGNQAPWLALWLGLCASFGRRHRLAARHRFPTRSSRAGGSLNRAPA